MGEATGTEGNASEVEDELPALQTDSSTLNRPDLMILSEENNENTYGPPPNIAARFHRPKTNRRRSSATSSRRNSLSSTHSHHSNRSYRRSSCKSSYIDQHLRRASILETRKARLADRAAHVEEVRNRAALAKATPRVSNTEERAQAAKQAREKYLAKVAATCAEEVSRAKRVAEEMKEKKAAEERRSRQELEEKHAEAERRRLEYRKTPRKHRASTVNADGKKNVETSRSILSEEAAKARIERVWRRYRRRKIVKAFTDLDITIDRVKNAGFTEASELLAEERVISISREVLSLLRLDSGADGDTTPVRTFLSAFMILGHPNEVFNKNGHQEQDLIGKAKDLVISFESILSEFANSTSVTAAATQLETLSLAHSTYLTAFAAWKSRDASILIETMVDQFVALDGIWQTVKDDTSGEVANDYRDGIRDQQVILLSKIKRLAGQDRANTLIKKAIRESRRQRIRRRPTGDVRPRPLIQPVAPSETPPVEPSAVESTIADPAVQSSPEAQNIEFTELSKVFSTVPPNRILVHELLIDPNYRIEVPLRSDVRNVLNREVCESMRQGIAEGQSEVWTVAVADSILKRLLKLLKPGNSMYKLLCEVLDPDHVRNQCRQGVFSYEKFFGFMADLLPKLCAPVRDDEVRVLAETLQSSTNDTDAMIEKLFGLLHFIDVMSLDYTNFMIQQSAPSLIKEGPGYEQRRFQEDLESNITTLARTKRWWRNASVNVLTEATSTDPRPMGHPSFAKIYARGLSDLAVGVGPIRKADLPETLQFDGDRLSRIRAQMQRFMTVGGILLTAKNLLKRDVRSQWKPEARRIHDSIRDAPPTATTDGELAARVLAIIDSSHGMPPSSREHLAAIVSRFLQEGAASTPPSDPVLKLLMQRLRAHIFARLSAQSSAERVRVASTSSEGLAAIGLSEFIGQVGACADELAKVCSVDLACHGEWYRQIAAEADGLGDE